MRVTDLMRWESDGPPEAGAYRITGPRGLLRNRGAATLAVVSAVGLGASAWFGVGYVRYERLVASQQSAAHNVEIANANLQDALTHLRDRLAAADRELNSAKSRVVAASGEAQRERAVNRQTANSDDGRIASLTRELHLTEAQRVTLMARLKLAEVSAAQGKARQKQAEAGLDEWQRKVQQLTADRDRATRERDRLESELDALQQQLAASQARQTRATPPAVRTPAPARESRAVAPAAPAGPAVATAAALSARSVASAARAAPAVSAAPPARPSTRLAATPRPAVAPVARPAPVPAVATGRLGQFERVLASAGVDLKHLFARFGVNNEGEGGPFVPVPRGGIPTLSPQKLAALSRIVRELPVSAPLTSYRISSPFGVRGDPMNGDHEFHTGMDLVAPYLSPVYATAPGVVTYAGFRSDYGRVVEINHGNGISTRYAHLHRYLVSVGQHVAAHQEIGLLGSSGRATGPHVHYEVLVNGEPQDPEKFFGLARLLPVSAQR